METLPTAVLKGYPGIPPAGEVTATGTLTVCVGETAYFYGSGTGAAEYQFLIGGVEAQARSAVSTYTSSGLNTGDQVTVRTYNAAGCFVESDIINIVTTTPPVIDFASSLPDNITFCSNTAITFTASSTGAANYNFTIDGGSVQSGASSTFLAVAGTVSDSTVVGVIVTGPSGCTASTTLTLVENKITTVGTIATVSSTICSGQVPAPITGTAGAVAVGGTLGYQWQTSPDGNPPWTNIGINGTSATYTPTAPLTENTYYKRLTISTRGGGAIICDESSNVILVSISGGPIANLLAFPGPVSETNTITICTGDTVEFLASGAGLGGTYQFLIGGVEVKARSSVTTYTSNSLISGNQVTVRAYNSEGCPQDSDPIFVTASPVPIVNLSSNLADDVTFCDPTSGGSAVIFTGESNVAGTTFQFFVNGVSKLGPSLTSTYSISSLNDSDVVSVTFTTPGGCSVYSALTMVKNTVTSAGTISPTTKITICEGDTPPELTETVSSSVAGTRSYEWYTSSDTLNWDPIGSSNSENYQPGSLTQTTYFKRRSKSTLSGQECYKETNVVEVFVAAPISGLGGTITPSNEVLCTGTKPTNMVISDGAVGPLITYQWQDSPDGVSFTNIAGETDKDLIFAPADVINSTTYYQRLTFAAGSASCVESSNIHKVTVNDIDPGSLDPNLAGNYCYGNTPPTLVSSPTGSGPDDPSSVAPGTLTYQWQDSPNNGTWTDIGGATNLVYNPPALISTRYYRRKVTSTLFDPTSSTTSTCDAFTTSIKFEILPELNNGSVLTDQTICTGETPNALTLNGASPISATTSYQWQRSDDNISWINIAGQTAAILPAVNVGATAPQTYYRVVISYKGAPAPKLSEKVSIKLSDRTPAVAPSNGVTYTISINNTTYTYTTSVASGTSVDSIGQGLSDLIDASDGTVNPTYDASTNIIALTQKVSGTYDLASSTSTPPSISVWADSDNSILKMKVLVSGVGPAAAPVSGAPVCQTYSDVAEITVNPEHTLTQDVGPAGTQTICDGEAIQEIQYAWGGGADFVIIEGLDPLLTVATVGTGTVTARFDLGAGVYYVEGARLKITGNPLLPIGNANTFSVATSSTLFNCPVKEESYTIIEENAIQIPRYIYKQTDTPRNVVVQSGGKWYNNTICQDASSSAVTETFFVCYGYAEPSNIEFEWWFEPPSAFIASPTVSGDTRSAVYSLEPSFSGSVTIKVRAETCFNVESDYLETKIDVVPETTPLSPATVLSAPEVLYIWDGCLYIGPEPECEITQNWIDNNGTTQYFASTTGTDTNNYASIEYRISPAGLNPTGSVATPGTINASTGVLTWNVGWSGQFYIQARAISCAGTPTVWSPSRLVDITETDLAIQSISVTDEPKCLIPAGGASSIFTATRTPSSLKIDWFIDNPNALTEASYVDSPTTDSDGHYVLDDNADETLTVNWNPGFSGIATIFAETYDASSDCPAEKYSRVVYIPQVQVLDLTSGGGSNLTQACQGSAITTITYEVKGAVSYITSATTGSTDVFPQGINSTIVAKAQVSTYTLAETGAAFTVGHVYQLSINGVNTSYTTLAGNNADIIGNGIASAINANLQLDPLNLSASTPEVEAQYIDATNELVLTSISNLGYKFETNITYPNTPAVNLGLPVKQEAINTLSIFGTITDNATPTKYDFNLITTATSGCATELVSGSITVNPKSTITFITGTNSITICDYSTFNPDIATVEIGNATGATVSGLPDGLSSSLSGSPARLTISGEVDLGVAVPTIFPVNITTTGNAATCIPETTQVINITVDPVPVITPIDPSVTDQTVCVSGTFINIEYEVNNINYGLTTTASSVFPPGISGELVSRQQVSEFQIGGGVTGPADTFTVNIASSNPFSGTVTATNGIATDALGAELASGFSALASPTYLFEYTAATDKMKITGPTGSPFFTTLSDTSALATVTSVSVITTPGVYTISGTPSNATTQTTPYIYQLTTNGVECAGATTVSGTIIINPKVGGAHNITSGSETQTICDNTSITTITYSISEGATGISGTWPIWLNVDLSDDKTTVTISTNDALKNIGIDYTTSYTYDVGFAGGGVCGPGGESLKGVITVNPQQKILVKDTNTVEQTVCEGDPMVPIEYDFYGSAASASFTPTLNLPDGVEGKYTPRKQIMNVYLTGPVTGSASQTYSTYINGLQYSFVSNAVSRTLVSIGEELSLAISSSPDVEATFTSTPSNTIVISALVSGTGFSAFVPANSNDITLSQPSLASSAGVFTISGAPTSIATSTSYNYILITNGLLCTPASATGTITVNPNSEISIDGGSNNNQILCDETSISTISYSLGGGALNYTITGLPNNIQHRLDNSGAISKVEIYGTPVTGDIATRIYSYTITTDNNVNGCNQVTATGSITIQPIEKIEISSPSGDPNQTVCVESYIDPVIYEIYGGATNVIVAGLPPGISQTTTLTQQITTLPFGGTNTTGITTETFIVYLNGEEIKYETNQIKTPAQIASEFQTLLNARPEVSASLIGSLITITGVSSGTGFTLDSSTGAPVTVTIGNPNTIQGTGQFAIHNFPTPASVSTGTQESYTFTLTTPGAVCSSTSVTGTIIVNPNSSISIVSSPTRNQTVCDDVDIVDIDFTYSGSAQGAQITWSPSLPNGISFTFDNASKTAKISGKPNNLNVLVPTVYTYTVSTTGNLNSCSEASETGSITVNPNDLITYDGTSGSRNQTVCSGSEITPIRYQLGGGATGATVLGLLPGLVYSVNASNVLTISGTVSDSNVLITNRSFTISTIGSCSPDISEDSGDFTVYPVSELTLTSALGSNIQTDGLCNDGIEDIAIPIQYTWSGGAQTVSITWSPFDPQFDEQSFGVPTKSFIIDGSTTANVSVTTIFSYELTTVNENGCIPEVTLTGQIEVNPKPIINTAAIQSLIVNESCFNASDGSIILPSSSESTFANYVTGGQTAVKQIDQTTFTGTTTTGDNFQLTLGSKSYSEIVTASPTFSQVLSDLVFKINNSPSPNDSPVTASLIGTNVLQLEAKVAGIPFNPVYNITSSDTVTETNINTQPNRVTNYSISWTKEGTNESVNPSALASGTYDLKVTLNGCESDTSSFTIVGATELKINDLSLCGGATTGAIQGSVSGGDGVYNIYLYDENGALVATHPNTGTASFTFSNLAIVGKTYRILYRDNTCTDASKWAERDNITLSTEITYDSSVIENTQSYCATGTSGNGSIETTKLIGGLPVNAFTGGSGNFSYEWKNSSNITVGNSPNVYNLPPGNYELTVTDLDLSCTRTENFTIGGYDSLDLQVNLLGPLVPVVNSGLTSSTADYIITLVCETGFDNAVIDVTSSGGASSYSFSWKKNGSPLAGGFSSTPPNSSASNLGVGLYEVTVTDSGPNGLFCSISKTVEVVAPSTPDVTYLESESTLPLCFGDTAKLVFQVTGGNLSETYQIQLDGTNYNSSWSTSSRTITINADPSTLPGTITKISIYDSNSCTTSEKTLTTPIVIPAIEEIKIVASSTDSDCESGVSGTITFEKTGTPFTSAQQNITQIKLELQGASAQTIYKTWSEISGGSGSQATISSLPTYGNYNYEITTNTGSNTCSPINGTVSIIDNTFKLNFDSPIVTNIGCSGDEKGKIVIPNITGVFAPLNIYWEKKELITTINTTPRGDDTDGDGFIDVDEQLQSTNPNDPSSTPSATLDSDGDGLTDSYENAISQTNPNLADSDNDGINDKLDGYPNDPLTSDLLVTSQQWTPISKFDGFNTASELDPGTYRAKVSDARSTNNPDCGGVKVTQELVIYKQSLSILNFKIEEQNVAADCNDPANAKSDITFTLQNGSGSNDYQVLIDGLPPSNYTKPASASNIHRVRNLIPGDYTLTVSSTFDGNQCKEEVAYTILQNEPITYAGETIYETDPCTGNLTELKAQATGGVPFIVDGVATYQYTWTYTSSSSGQVIYVGDTILNAEPGSYSLEIKDSVGCILGGGAGVPQIIEVKGSAENFEVKGGLDDPNTVGVLEELKSLPPDCDSATENGKISLEVTGGQLPYQINWYIEDLSTVSATVSGSTSNIVGYKLLSQYQNQLNLNNLSPGNYKVIINSQNTSSSCGTQKNNSTYYEENIIVEPNRELYIMDGPYLSTNLCNGDEGDIKVKVFDNNNGDLTFKYNNISINSSDVTKIDAFTYNVKIVNAIDSAIFRITNPENECYIEETIERKIGKAGFTYTSPNFNDNNSVLAREEVTFDNTSTQPYVRSEWIFGDNSPVENVNALTASVTTVRHTYGVSGTYLATLRVYNSVECYDETTQEIVVGKGYNILVPNVFTPDDNKINDTFRPIFTGFKSMNFAVYDYRGNLLYFEQDIDPTILDASICGSNKTAPIEICGWDGTFNGKEYYSPYYIYTATGEVSTSDPSKNKEVIKSGTFILIK